MARASKPPGRRGGARRGGLLGVSNAQAALGALAAAAAVYYYAYAGGSAASSTNLPEKPPARCEDADSNCPVWAEQGECTINTAYMHGRCALSCGVCVDNTRPKAATRTTVDRRYMCERDPAARPTLAAGTMGQVFREAVSNFPQYEPAVLSTDPWVLTFDNLLSEAEANRLFELGAKTLERSASVAGLDSTGNFKKAISDVRTSANSWCLDSDCGTDPLVKEVTARIAQVTQSDPKAFELYQVLRYQPGEYYREHHDWVDAHTQFPFGPRVFTFFLYLSDVEEGGGTHFPALNITVQPKLGRALWWPSVLEATPDKQDSRTTHEAQPVVRGMKRAANVWIHLYDFMTPYSKGCAP